QVQHLNYSSYRHQYLRSKLIWLRAIVSFLVRTSLLVVYQIQYNKHHSRSSYLELMPVSRKDHFSPADLVFSDPPNSYKVAVQENPSRQILHDLALFLMLAISSLAAPLCHPFQSLVHNDASRVFRQHQTPKRELLARHLNHKPAELAQIPRHITSQDSPPQTLFFAHDDSPIKDAFPPFLASQYF